MTNSVEIEGIRLFAQTCLDWLLNPGHELLIDGAALAGIRELGNLDMDQGDLVNLGRRLRDTNRFQAGQAVVAQRWGGKWKNNLPPDIDTALEFIEGFMDLVDHGVFFNQGITSGVTHIRRGEPANNVLNIPGDMPCWTIHFTSTGKALFLSEQIELEVERGSLMMFRPEANYHYGLAPDASEWKHLWLLFQPRAQWSDWLNWETIGQGIFYAKLRDEQSSVQIESLFEGLIELKTEPSVVRSALEHNRVEEILIRVGGYQQPATQLLLDNRVARACQYMEDRLTSSCSLEEVAAACHVSSSRLSHLFKQQLGVGPRAWANNLRMQLAKKLLLNSSGSIATIATETGFRGPTQFTRYFRNHVGCSPRDFRRSFRQRTAFNS